MLLLVSDQGDSGLVGLEDLEGLGSDGVVVELDDIVADFVFDELVDVDWPVGVLELEVVEYDFLGLDVADDVLFVLTVDQEEAVLELCDAVGDVFGDELVFLEHEEFLEGSHEVFESLVGMVHHSIYELYLQLVQIILLYKEVYFPLVVYKG